MIAEVIVDVAHGEVDRVFDYKIEQDRYALGSRVEVPFGRQTLEGFIIGLKPKSDLPESKIKEVIRCLDEFPVLSTECLALARFVKERYHVPFGKERPTKHRYCQRRDGRCRWDFSAKDGYVQQTEESEDFVCDHRDCCVRPARCNRENHKRDCDPNRCVRRRRKDWPSDARLVR